MNDLEIFIKGILQTINYQGDHDNFSKELSLNVFIWGLNESFKLQSAPYKDVMLDINTNGFNKDKHIPLIIDWLKQEDNLIIFENKIKSVLGDYIANVSPTLNESELNDLNLYLSKYQLQLP